MTALVTLMSAIWSKIRALATKFVTKGDRCHEVKAGWMSEALGGGGKGEGEGKKGIGADGDKMKESGRG